MIHISNVTKQHGPKILYRNATFQINSGEKIGLVGPNGSGKTTLFRLIMGEEGHDEGQISKPDKIRVGYYSQTIEDMKGRSALEEVKAALPEFPKIQERIQFLEQKLSSPDLTDDEMTKVLEEYGDLQTEFEKIGGYDMESKAAEILTGLGIGPNDYHRPCESFSGGWKMRIALAKVLLAQPDVLLMDEPTNHLDLESIIWLEEWMKNFSGSLFMTCHDRDFMNRIVSKIVEVAYQKVSVYSGNYDFYEKERDIRMEQLVASARRQEDMLAKEKEFISRFAARASHAAQVQSRVKKLEKIDIIEIPTEEKVMSFEWPTPPRGGDEVVRVTGLGKTYDTQIHQADGSKSEVMKKLVFENASALVKRLDRIAMVGVNGAGKSTFLKILTGQTEPTSGTFAIGPSIEMGYFSQNSLDLLDPEATIMEEVERRIQNPTIGYIRSLLGAFRFSGDEPDKKIKVLSGGEKSRVILATILAKPVNFLVLDEPTNHLDIGSREVLLQAILNFPGTVMIVSHDRHFLRAITNRVFELDRQHLNIYDGNWDYYLEKKAQQK